MSNAEIININNYICERCRYLFENYSDDVTEISKEEILKTKTTSNCNFCFGIFEFEKYENLISEVKRKISDYEHTDFKIAISFSFIFDLVHFFWRSFLKNNKDIKIKNLSLLTPNLLKTIFRQLFLNTFSKNIHETCNLNSDLKIEILFEFPQKIYDEINAMFKYLNKNIILKPNDKIKCNIGVKDVLDMPTGLIVAVFQKFKLINLSSELDQKIGIEKQFFLVKDSLYLKGSYNKYSREIGQSPWEINGERVCVSSVEEEIKPFIIKEYESDDMKFSAGGREDRDVRMLGVGRPFMIEVINPKKNIVKKEDILKIGKKINENSKLIKVNSLESCDKDYVEFIKKAEINKMKIYSCFVWVQKKLTNDDINKLNIIKNMDVIQKTPLRVLHRRSLMDRKKLIYEMKAEKVSDHFMILDIVSSAGTYIKEFVHSDLMRTNPSVKSLLDCDVDILQLDVRDLILLDDK